jgi:putative aldouronate transport system permease protein
MVRSIKPADKIFDFVNILIMLTVIFLTLYPFWYTVVGSLNIGADYMRGGVNFWPRKFTLENYFVVLKNKQIASAFGVSIARTVIGTLSSVLFTAIFAYGFSRKNLMGKGVYATIALITMYFGGGLIPYFLLIKNLHLLDNFLVYIIPSLFSFWNVLIMQSFFKEIPESTMESARMDGAGEYKIFFKLIIPLSMPVLATITLFNGVGHWNSYFDSMLFTNKQSLQTIQVLLMKVIRNRDAAISTAQMSGIPTAQLEKTVAVTLQLATMVVATVPILVLYPFLQRYFVSGMTIGSIKG